MMVNPYDDSRLMLALQIDHSRVAGFFAAHWGNRDFARPEPYASVVLAAHEHDIGWWEWEMKPSTLNDKGFPMDYHDGSFKYLGQLRLDFYKNAVDRVLQAGSLCGAVDGDARGGADERGLRQVRLSAGSHRGSPGESLRRRSGALRVKLVEELRQSEFKDYASEEQIWTNYEYMEVFDQLAQFVCNRYPLNSKWRKLGPTNTLNDVDVPTKHRQSTGQAQYRHGVGASGDSQSLSV